MTEIPEIFRLRECPRCRYDLAQIPHGQRCPECGLELGPETIAVGGSAMSRELWLMVAFFVPGMQILLGIALIALAATHLQRLASSLVLLSGIVFLAAGVCNIWIWNR